MKSYLNKLFVTLLLQTQSEDDQTKNSIASILIQVLTQEKFRQVFISEENPYKN